MHDAFQDKKQTTFIERNYFFHSGNNTLSST